MDRGGEGCRGGGLGRRSFEAHAQFAEDVLSVRQHVHQMADRRALIAGDIADAVLQKRLGDREDAFALEHLAVADAQLFDLFGE